jgi:hypothetical protein
MGCSQINSHAAFLIIYLIIGRVGTLPKLLKDALGILRLEAHNSPHYHLHLLKRI